MMSTRKIQGEATMPALAYANRQIDQFVERGRLTFTELALIVEAIYMMSNVSGSLVLTYALMTRAKTLVLDERGYFTIQPADSPQDHMIPSFLRDLPFYVEHKVKFESIGAFTPLFALGLGANTVVLKNTVWVRSRERHEVHLPVLLGSQAVDALQVRDNKHASVSVPVVHLVKHAPVCSLIQLPAGAFEKVQAAVSQGNVTMQLRKPFGKSNASPELVVKHTSPAMEREAVQKDVGSFWQQFSVYAQTIAAQNAKMPKHVVDAVAHTLINAQKSPADLAKQLY